MSILDACMYMCLVLTGQVSSDALELELQMIVSQVVGARNLGLLWEQQELLTSEPSISPALKTTLMSMSLVGYVSSYSFLF